MRRQFFHLSTALLAFGIGLLSVSQFYTEPTEQIFAETSNKIAANVSEIASKSKQNNYGCEEKELVAFWEKLDKEAFLDFSKATLEKFWGKDSMQFEWEQIKNFDCSYFRMFQAIDVNGDGEKEILLRGRLASNRGDMEILLFRLKQEKYEPILFDVGGEELKLTNKKYNWYSEIILKTEWFTGGGRKISRYRFDGKDYKPINCFTEYDWINDINGNFIKYKKTLRHSVSCSSD